MHHPAAGRLGDLLPHPGTGGAGRGKRGTRPAQGWGPLRVGVRPQKQGSHLGAQLEGRISLPPPSEAGVLTEGQGHSPAGARRTVSAPRPLLACTLHARLSLQPRLGAPGNCPRGGRGGPCSLGPLSRRQEVGAPGTEAGTCRAPTLSSSLPPRGEGMHQPGFTLCIYLFIFPRHLGSKGTIRSRHWYLAGPLPLSFSAGGGGEVSREGEARQRRATQP